MYCVCVAVVQQYRVFGQNESVKCFFFIFFE